MRRNVYETWSYLMKLRSYFSIFSNPESAIQTWLNGTVKKIYYEYENNNAILVANFDVKESVSKITLPHDGVWFNAFLNDSFL